LQTQKDQTCLIRSNKESWQDILDQNADIAARRRQSFSLRESVAIPVNVLSQRRLDYLERILALDKRR
jgi:hypothetical protein